MDKCALIMFIQTDLVLAGFFQCVWSPGTILGLGLQVLCSITNSNANTIVNIIMTRTEFTAEKYALNS